MYRVVVFKSTGKLVPGQMQSGGDISPSSDIEDEDYAAQNLQVMIDNAVAAGYSANDIEAKFISDEDWAALQAISNQAAMAEGQNSKDYAALVALKNKRFNNKVAKALNVKI